MAKVLASDCWIRQSQITPSVFEDVPASLAPYVQAVTSAGGPMRDTFMQGGAVMFDSSQADESGGPPQGATIGGFNPSGNVTRADLATWLVRALGKDADAQAAMVVPRRERMLSMVDEISGGHEAEQRSVEVGVYAAQRHRDRYARARKLA